MKILLATDGSRHAREAVRLLRILAAERDFDVEVAAVIPPASSDAPPHPRLEDQVSPDVAAGWLASAESELAASGLRVRSVLLEGTPEEALVSRCREGGHDLVVAGVKGRGATPFFELGRVASHLVRWSPASVLLVRKRAALRPEERTRQAGDARPDAKGFRVLLPTNGHAACLEASRRLIETLSPDQATVDLVNVAEPSLGADPDADAAVDAPRRWLAQAAGDRGWGRTRARSSLLRGRPAAAIARWAASSESDLLVLGTRPPREGAASRLGRTGQELAWSSPCSVLMVRS